MRAVHDLKGEAGTLGMHELEQSAAALERACLEGVRDADIDEVAHEVTHRLGKVMDELRALESARAN